MLWKLPSVCLLALLALAWAEESTDVLDFVETIQPDGTAVLQSNDGFFDKMKVTVSYVGANTLDFTTPKWLHDIERIVYQVNINREIKPPERGQSPPQDLYTSPYAWNFTDPSIVGGATAHYYVTIYLTGNPHRAFHSSSKNYTIP